MINIHSLGDLLLHAALVVSFFAALASIVGYLRKEARLLMAGERAGYVVTGLLVTASCLLLHAFVTHDYGNKYVENYSDNAMPWYYLIASFWGGQAGSFLFWAVVLSICTAFVIWQNRYQNRDFLPVVLAVLMGVQIFFLSMMVLEANPFAQFNIREAPINGRGLEPLLQNPAMLFHPPAILAGYVWFTVPFAFAVAALILRRLDDTWIRTTRHYAVISWAFLSVGNLLGGMWAYQELGWGGFWGWDPVENAALMPWLTASAYLHSVMIQERRDMLRVWNMLLVLLTYFLTFFGTAITRSGFIDSVHTFAQSDIGDYFIVAIFVLGLGSAGLLLWRVVDGSLASRTGRQLMSIFSREGAFLLNNWVLLGATIVVMLGTVGEKISAHFWQETKYTASWFNAWMSPIGLMLLLLMGIGPLISWRKATGRNFRRNFVLPILVGAAGAAAWILADAYDIRSRLAATYVPVGDAPMGRWVAEAELTGVYVVVGVFGVLFVICTLAVEFLRGAWVRRGSTGEALPVAFVKMMAKNRRRYGGYVTHLGFALLFMGFMGVGLKTEADLGFSGPGASHVLKDKHMTFEGLERTHNVEYEQWDAVFTIRALGENGQVGETIGVLRPARRLYHGHSSQMAKSSTEKDELSGWTANLYLTLVSFRPGGKSVEITAHYNPLIFWMWIGGGFLLFGVIFAIWPVAERYPVFEAARRSRRRGGDDGSRALAPSGGDAGRS